MRIVLALQVAGLLLIGVGGFLLAPWLGVLLLGVGCVVFGIALERGGQ